MWPQGKKKQPKKPNKKTHNHQQTSPLHPSTAQFHCSYKAEMHERHDNQPFICSISHPLPYYQRQGDKRSHAWNLPRLQDDQKENAGNKVFGTASVSDKPRWMADRAILAQVFHSGWETEGQTILNTNPQRLQGSHCYRRNLHPNSLTLLRYASQSDPGSLQLNTPVPHHCLRNAPF